MTTLKSNSRPPGPRQGFTLIELLVVIGVIGILASLLMPSLSKAKAKANQIKCLNNARQMGLALTMYAADHDGHYPPRRRQGTAWPHRLFPYHKDWQTQVCPSDRFSGPKRPLDPDRSFIINAFNDFFQTALSDTDYRRFKNWTYPKGMKETDIPRPSDTIVFGEKRKGSFHVHMDVDQGQRGNDFEQVDHNRHGRGSNFVFADNSVRLVAENAELYPENLWAVVDKYRVAPGKPQ